MQSVVVSELEIRSLRQTTAPSTPMLHLPCSVPSSLCLTFHIPRVFVANESMQLPCAIIVCKDLATSLRGVCGVWNHGNATAYIDFA